MFAAATSVVLVGVEARPVRVEVEVGGPRQVFSVVGLPDAAVREAKERVRSAIRQSGYTFPKRWVTVNLAPADLPKMGSAYDLPIALGVLAATNEIPQAACNVVALGELALDGRVRSVRGGLGAGLVARSTGKRCLLATASAAEASVVPDADVRAVATLADAVAVALGESDGSAIPRPPSVDGDGADLAEVRGQLLARRAVEVAAAGGHHLLMSGPPGSGKTMLARCLPGILPELGSIDTLAVAQAWSAAGRSRADPRRPPFRSPHHSATMAAIVGGGSGVPVPGEVTLAHKGVLFLDELGEFPVHLLNALRQPLEEGTVRVARKGAAVTFPCSAQVVAATNPCPCGFGDDGRKPCGCAPGAVARYRRRLSGPLLDRFDLRVEVQRLDTESMVGPPGESSSEVRARVEAARRRQQDRGRLNRDLGRSALDRVSWESGARALLRSSIDKVGLTGRGWDRVRRVACTVADLAGEDAVGEAHVAEALSYRVSG